MRMTGHLSIQIPPPSQCAVSTFLNGCLPTVPGMQDQTNSCSLDHADHTTTLAHYFGVGQLDFKAEESCHVLAFPSPAWRLFY